MSYQWSRRSRMNLRLVGFAPYVSWQFGHSGAALSSISAPPSDLGRMWWISRTPAVWQTQQQKIARFCTDRRTDSEKPNEVCSLSLPAGVLNLRFVVPFVCVLFAFVFFVLLAIVLAHLSYSTSDFEPTVRHRLRGTAPLCRRDLAFRPARSPSYLRIRSHTVCVGTIATSQLT